MNGISESLYQILTNEKVDKFVMTLNAPWGYGKPHIAAQLIDKMRRSKDSIPVIPIFIDLSDYDYVNDPLIPFIVEILHGINLDKLISPEKKLELIKTIKDVALYSAKVLATFEPSGIGTKVIDMLFAAKEGIKDEKTPNTDTLLLEFKSYSELILKLSNEIENLQNLTLISDKDGTVKNIRRVVVFVDNFDRVECRFTFKFLNLIDKITAKNISFCLLMNKEQLEKNIYNNMLSHPANNNEHFLNKYVDFEYCLPHLNDRIDEILPCLNIKIFKEFVRMNNKHFEGISIRQIIEIEKLYSDFTDKFANAPTHYNDELLIKLACYIITTKDILIQLYYNFIPRANILPDSVSAKLWLDLFDSNINANATIGITRPILNTKADQYTYTINKILFHESFTKLNEAYNQMMKVLLKEI